MRIDAWVPMMCAPKNHATVGIRQDLHKTGGVFEGPAVGSVTVGCDGRDIALTSLLELLFGRANRGNLWIGEDCRRNEGKGQLLGRSRDSAGYVVRRVLHWPCV
jgi:hypothetical protein